MIPNFQSSEALKAEPEPETRRSIHPLRRCLGEAICLEYQMQNAAAMLWDDDELSDGLDALLHAVHRQAVAHIADLDPEVRAQALDRSQIAQQIAEAERIFGPMSSATTDEHLRVLCGLMLEATLTYESLLLSAAAAGRSELAALARENLGRCARVLVKLDAQWLSVWCDELVRSGSRMPAGRLALYTERIERVTGAVRAGRLGSLRVLRRKRGHSAEPVAAESS